MAKNDQMPEVDFVKDGEIDRRLLQQIKFVERQNLVRVTRLNRMRKNARYTGFLLGGIALGIYGFSIYSIKQESFLDDFDEPEVTTNTQ
ncbi:cytochrome c oxidase assembly factor 3, mitochondrial [Adelges cooleyi]|uniref:cytochrome c oxidase assembly factor 3, mitochondrial n=1 Tax=Adelges cooleyi TaxID=133065 RepID=UPI002180879F|nr:cytochrome c oxidase assembly factor 3, mitochondrial [Adelges cooleyi]XP_050431435.1 cytochrome c oxidase assembly factor 3, mitochondrial [Adelges cooleyi]